MRATGSNDIVLDGVFVPDAAVQLRRPKGVWHPFFNVIAAVALPIVLSVYLGVAEAARDLALQQVAKKRDDPDVWALIGEMENALVTGQMAVREMVELCADYAFAPEVAHCELHLCPEKHRRRVLTADGRKGARDRRR